MQEEKNNKKTFVSVFVVTFWQIPQVTTARAEILKLECGHVVKMTQKNGVNLKTPNLKPPNLIKEELPVHLLDTGSPPLGSG